MEVFHIIKIEYVINHKYTFEEIDGEIKKVLNCTSLHHINALKNG